MAKIKVEFDNGEAMSVSCGIVEYIRRIRRAKVNPNDILARSIRKNCISELRTAYNKLEKAIQER